MKLTWLGHSCFLLEQEGYTILLDPYEGVEGYPPLYETAVRALDPGLREQVTGNAEKKLRVNRVLCSHQHFDHNAVGLTELLPEAPCPFTIRKVETFHDDQGGALRGINTVHILTAGGVTLAHMGDLGHQLSAEQVKEIGRLDAILIPVGGYYTIDAKGARAVCEALKPRCVIPMHYHHAPYGLPVVGGVEEFLSLFPDKRIGRPGGPSLVLNGVTAGVLVPKFPGEG